VKLIRKDSLLPPARGSGSRGDGTDDGEGDGGNGGGICGGDGGVGVGDGNCGERKVVKLW
jgi:hypothetical protein